MCGRNEGSGIIRTSWPLYTLFRGQPISRLLVYSANKFAHLLKTRSCLDFQPPPQRLSGSSVPTAKQRHRIRPGAYPSPFRRGEWALRGSKASATWRGRLMLIFVAGLVYYRSSFGGAESIVRLARKQPPSGFRWPHTKYVLLIAHPWDIFDHCTYRSLGKNSRDHL